MKRLSLDEVKKIELDILVFIKKICEEENIAFYLDSGTLLGAVRHRGFIPWDDDIDIIVRREDYYRLLEAIDNRNTKYQSYSIRNRDDYYYCFGKVVDTSTIIVENGLKPIKNLGVYVDVIPIEHQPNNAITRRLFQKQVLILRSIVSLALLDSSDKRYSFLKRFIIKMCSLYGVKKAIAVLDKLCSRHAKKETDYSTNMVCSFNPYRVVPDSCYEPSCLVAFEGELFPAPGNYDRYLSILYGDYMELPPEEKRVSNHDFIAHSK